MQRSERGSSSSTDFDLLFSLFSFIVHWRSGGSGEVVSWFRRCLGLLVEGRYLPLCFQSPMPESRRLPCFALSSVFRREEISLSGLDLCGTARAAVPKVSQVYEDDVEAP